MNHIFGRSTAHQMPTAIKGDGCYIIDESGKRYLDGSGGAAVSCLGHSNENVKQAISEQLAKLDFAHTGFFTSEPAEKLADLLIENAPEGIDRVYLVSGGSEAVEAALKVARQYYLEIGEPNRHKVIARKQSYHGNTLGALAAGGNEWRRAQFSPLLVDVSHIAPCYEFRGKKTNETTYEYGQRVANELETQILELGAENIMAFVAEPVVGATLGAVPPVKGYFKRIREICNQHGILLILDEVMCGMGRTGTLFACEQDNISPDIITIAKGLGAGYQPIGAMLCTDKIYNAIKVGSGFFQHGHTYMGHPLASAASLTVLKEILERDLLTNVKQQGNKLQDHLNEVFGQHENIGDIRGRGLFRGLEIVSDRSTKTPLDASKGTAKKIKAAAFDAGLICYPMSGTIDGKNGDHILLAPPFIINDDQIIELVDKLKIAFDKTL